MVPFMGGKTAGNQLRFLLQNQCVCIPGAFNGIVGRLCADQHFSALYLSGGALSATHGVPDIGLLSLEHFTNAIKDITYSSGLPVFADADTGFGEVEMVSRTVFEYSRAGAGGLHIEDQVFPKKCGHLEGKELVPADTFCQKIKAAIQARNKTQTNMVICARTDAYGVEGLQSAINRAKQYCEAGADMIFPEGISSESDFETFAKEMRKVKGEAPQGGPYLVANMTEFGKTPPISVHTFEKLGYNCVIFPVSTLRVAMKAVQDFLGQLYTHGIVDNELQKKMYTRKELYSTLHYDTSKEWEFPSPSVEFIEETNQEQNNQTNNNSHS